MPNRTESYVIRQLKKKEQELIEKIATFKSPENRRCIVTRTSLKKNQQHTVVFNLKKQKFTRISTSEYTIEL